MIKKSILLASVLAISACSANKVVIAPNEVEALVERAEKEKAACLNCGEAALLLTKIENKQCGTPYNTETFDRFVQSEPVYAFVVALSVLTGQPIEQFSDVLEDSIECNDPAGWVDRLRVKIKNVKFQNEIHPKASNG